MFSRAMPVSFVGFAIVALLAVFLSGCTTRTSDRDLVFLNPAEALEAVQGERRMLRGSTTGVWLDPRTDREYREGHIPGAIHMPMQRVREDHASLREYDVIIVYGNDFNSPRATAVSKTLLELGHRDVRTLRGGLKAWKEAGHSLQTSQ